MDYKQELIGYCGFYCGSCPTYLNGSCKGCREAHKPGDCFTFDCVRAKKINFCGECADFPCAELFINGKATVLDFQWLAWKARERG